MNKVWYDNYGNPFKIYFRKHYCYKCGEVLGVLKHRRIVNPNSPEGKNFYIGMPGIGDFEIIHKAFYCQKCREWVEFETQVSLEDVDIVIKKTESYFRGRKKNIRITKYYELKNGTNVAQCLKLDLVKSICLLIACGDNCVTYKVPIMRREAEDRNYYCKIKKRKLIKFIKKQIV